MRALIAHPGPSFSVADVYRGWAKGLAANGVEVAEFNLDDRLSFFSEALLDRNGEIRRAFSNDQAIQIAAESMGSACYQWWPDVIVIISGFFVSPFWLKVIQSRGHKIVIVHTESPYEDDRQLTRAEYADLNVLNDPTNIEKFRDIGPTIYLPHAYDPAVHRPRRKVKRCASDFAFVGTGFPSRVEFLEKVDWTGIDVLLAGNWKATIEESPLRRFLAHDIDVCCPNDETARIYASTKVSANLYRKEATYSAEGWAMGPREVELAACGTYFLREPRGEGDEVLSMLPTFETPDEFGDRLRWALRHPKHRAEAARRAREAVAPRTFDNNVAAALTALGI